MSGNSGFLVLVDEAVLFDLDAGRLDGRDGHGRGFVRRQQRVLELFAMKMRRRRRKWRFQLRRLRLRRRDRERGGRGGGRDGLRAGRLSAVIDCEVVVVFLLMPLLLLERDGGYGVGAKGLLAFPR